MARRKGTLNRMDLREQNEAAERLNTDESAETEEEEVEDEDEEDEDEEGEEAEEAEAEVEEDEDSEALDDEDEPRPKKKKKKKAVKVEKPTVKRSRTRVAKVVRQRVVWGVFNNSNQRVATFEYPKRAEADAQAVKLSTEKKSTFFVQPVKEAIEEKKE